MGILITGAAVPLLAACGGNGQISVKLAFAGSQGPFTPTDQPKFTVVVTNNGPSDAPGVEVRVDLPSSMHYRTSTITGFGNARTQVVDARDGTSQPAWGFWDLAAPSSGSNLCQSCVAVTFTTDLTAQPGDLHIMARAQGDNTGGEVNSDDLKLTVQGAPKLDVSARVQAGTLTAGAVATYAVTITNNGTGPAEGVALLVTLPPVMTWQKTNGVNGNGSRSNPIDPVKGAVEAFYSGWTLPAASGGGPGVITISFVAAVSAQPPTGSYTINAQVTDQGGDQVTLANSAPVQVVGVSASAAPSTAPTTTPTPSR